MEFSFPPKYIWILLGFAKTNQFQSVREVRPNLTLYLVKICKGFSKSIKENILNAPFELKSVGLRRSRRLFRHQDLSNRLISYFRCDMCNMKSNAI
jgi:hypothetical protein